MRKIHEEDFALPFPPGRFSEFIESFPNIGYAKGLKEAVSAIVEAAKNDKMIIVGIGGHVIKVGLGPILNDLIRKGIIKHIAMNGAAVIHDVEVAIYGNTSENVDLSFPRGSFGFDKQATRVCNFINKSINEEVGKSEYRAWPFYLETIARDISHVKSSHRSKSVLYTANEHNLRMSAHVAIGTDINHMHSTFDGRNTGQALSTDFRMFCGSVRNLKDGVYINMGSAVLLPEVFMKAVTLGRRRGYDITNFTTIVMDFMKQYRPARNVCERPTDKGIYLVGAHEIVLPLLWRMILEEL